MRARAVSGGAERMAGQCNDHATVAWVPSQLRCATPKLCGRLTVINTMSALYLSIGTETDQVVRRPCPSDAIGAALRGVFDAPPMPEDMARLLRRLDRR
jgi:hypothetical protein